MKNYKLIFWSLRFHGRIFFKKLYVEVRRIWQPQDGLICMRWTVHGIPRVPWEAEGTFDGISQYKLDSEGKIYEHAVDNVILRDPPMQGIGPLLAGLNLVPGQPQQPVPGGIQAAASVGPQPRCCSSCTLMSSRGCFDIYVLMCAWYTMVACIISSNAVHLPGGWLLRVALFMVLLCCRCLVQGAGRGSSSSSQCSSQHTG